MLEVHKRSESEMVQPHFRGSEDMPWVALACYGQEVPKVLAMAFHSYKHCWGHETREEAVSNVLRQMSKLLTAE